MLGVGDGSNLFTGLDILPHLRPTPESDDLVVDIAIDTVGSVISSSLICSFSGSASVLCSNLASISCSDS